MSKVAPLTERLARAAASTRANTIRDACALAGKPDRANDLIASDMSDSEVLQMLAQENATESWAPHIARINAAIAN